MVTFDTAFDRLISHEGGYSNDPNDPGGETKFGIAKRFHPNVDIKNLTRDQAKDIYKSEFWDIIGDSVDPAIKFQVFDFAVNTGIQTAIRKLQDSVGVADDGHWGSKSAEAAVAMNKRDVIIRFNANKIRFYTKLSKFDNFGRGWMNRVADDLDLAVQDSKD